MDIRHLRYFLAVVEHGTVTAAARRLHVAQSAVSRQIQALERSLGVTLFTRNGPQLTLSEAGTRMLAVATDLVTRADRAKALARQLAEGTLARVSVAAASTTITEVLAPFVATLTPDDPFVSVGAVAADAVHNAVRTTHDLGIAATEPPSKDLAWRALTAVPLRAYVSRDHPWARDGKTAVTVAELLRGNLILPVPEDPTRGTLDRAVAAAGLAYGTGTTEDNPWPPLRQALAASGRGIAVMTDLRQFDSHAALVTDPHGNPLQLALHACWNHAHYAAAAIETFVTRLETFAATTVHDAAWRIPDDTAPSPAPK